MNERSQPGSDWNAEHGQSRMKRTRPRSDSDLARNACMSACAKQHRVCVVECDKETKAGTHGCDAEAVLRPQWHHLPNRARGSE